MDDSQNLRSQEALTLAADAAALLLARRRLEGSAGASEGKKKGQEVTPP